MSDSERGVSHSPDNLPSPSRRGALKVMTGLGIATTLVGMGDGTNIGNNMGEEEERIKRKYPSGKEEQRDKELSDLHANTPIWRPITTGLVGVTIAATGAFLLSRRNEISHTPSNLTPRTRK